jgi:hypothetical protein
VAASKLREFSQRSPCWIPLPPRHPALIIPSSLPLSLPALLSHCQIGIQIRMGDWQLTESWGSWFHPQKNPGLYAHYFRCAQQIEDEVAKPGQRVVW